MDDTSALYTIDPATGAGTLVGAITGFSNVSGLAFHPATGVLYGVGLNASDTHVLLTIDPATGLGTELGPTNVATASGCSERIPDLAFRADGALFACAAECDQLGTLDIATGAFTLLGDTGAGEAGNGIAFVGGALFHAGFAELNTLNQSTGAATLVAELTFPVPCGIARVNALDVQPGSGTVFAGLRCGVGPINSTFRLATLNVTTGVITDIGATVSRLDAIAFQPAFVPLADFRDVRRPNNITIGPGLGGTGHQALNVAGTAGSAGTARLGAAIAENRWYRVTMDVAVGAGLVSVFGAVWRLEDQFDPNSPVVTPSIGSVNLVADPLGVGALVGVDATGEVGILSAAVGGANGSSVTNVSILPQDFGGDVIIFD